MRGRTAYTSADMLLMACNTYHRRLHNKPFHTLCPLPSPEGQVGIGILFFLPLLTTSEMKGFLGHRKPGEPSTQSANTAEGSFQRMVVPLVQQNKRLLAGAELTL